MEVEDAVGGQRPVIGINAIMYDNIILFVNEN